MSNKKFTPNNQRYFKRNFSEVINKLTPVYYNLEDRKLFGEQEDPVDLVVNSHITLASEISQVFSMPVGTVFSALSTFDGIGAFFNKRNTFSDIDKFKFEKTVLFPLNKSLGDFQTSAEFSQYINSDFIPYLNSSRSDKDSVDEYCNKLGWFYLLATSGAAGDVVQPSSIVSDYFTDNLFNKNDLTTYDAINALTEYLWKNEKVYVPDIFLSGTGEYTSGYQQLEKLKTLNSIIYSNLYLDRFDTYVSDAFENYKQLQQLSVRSISNGAYERMMKAFSFAFADQQDEANRLGTLYDLQDCPDEYLQELAYLIGWKLVGYDRNKWRVQLANALSIYKKAGTKQSIQAALNSLFSEDGIDFDSHMTELWESYIPFLILYALATESTLFKNFSTLSVADAESLGIDNYDFDNFEDNIRAGVDNILLKLFKKHPELFKLGAVPFPQNSEDFVFRYRNKVYEIPPFEEIPYYITSEVTADFLDSLEEFLYCYGVNEEFARKVRQYIQRKTIDDHSDFAIDNSWLFFTSSLEMPPNWGSLTTITEKDKVKYLSLWNGKSSHYLLEFNADSFDFSKVDYTPDSKYAIIQSARLADELSPAHAIPLTRAYLSAVDAYDDANTSSLAEIVYDYADYPASLSSMSFGNVALSGLDILQGNYLEFSSLGRRLTQSIYSPSAEFESGSINEGGTFNTSAHVVAPRTSLRRRNLKNAINLFGFYDRTGFNPPVFKIGKIPGYTYLEDSELITRGLIPSSMEFRSTDSSCSGLMSSIPDVYKLCSPNHVNPYFGYYLSSTIPVRGELPYQTDLQGSSMYEDRGSLDPLMYLIYKIERRKVEGQIQKELLEDPRTFAENTYWYNFSGSEANRRISCGNTALSSIDGYYNYSFGRKLHMLYHQYVTAFNYHPLTAQKYSETVTDIITHCFGSILRNSDFELRGDIARDFNLYTSSLNDPKPLTLRSTVFLQNSEVYDTVTQSTSVYGIAKKAVADSTVELVNSKLIKDVDVVHTANSSTKNSFEFLDLQNNQAGSYAKNNTIVKLKSLGGLPRLRFIVEGSDFTDASGIFRAENFLSPNHKFSVTIKGLAAYDTGESSDAQIGVWVHTVSNSTGPFGTSYHYNPTTRDWDPVFIKDITIENILENYTQVLSFDQKDVTGVITRCLAPATDLEGSSLTTIGIPSYASIKTDPLEVFEEQYFSEVSATFNTIYGCRSAMTSSTHNVGQTYVVEVFMIPNLDNYNKFVLLDNISLRDDTLNDYTKIDLAGEPIAPLNYWLCDPIQMELTEEEIRTIMRSFAVFSGKDRPTGFLSRRSTQTSAVHYDEGGSRLSYRDSPAWYGPTLHTTKQITNISIH